MKTYLKIISGVLLFAGCAGVPSYQGVETSMAEGNYEAAAQKVEKASGAYSKRSRLVFYMDRLMTSQLAGRYRTSNLYAEKAYRLMDALYTKSLSGEASTWILNDSKRDYRGEHFEQILVHLFSLVNYAMLGNPEEALVEARRADLKFREYSRVHGDKTSYREDALMRWLAAVMYEAQGEKDDAYLDYKNSLQAFERYATQYGDAIPDQAIADTRRLAKHFRDKEYIRELDKKFPHRDTPPLQEGKADLVVLLYEGLAPYKITDRWDVPVPDSDGTIQYFSLAYPQMQGRASVLNTAFVELGAQGAHPLALFEDIQAIAQGDLSDRLGRIKAKAIARAVLKFSVGRRIQEKQDSEGKKLLAGFLSNLFTVVSEQADTRSWRTLPARIYVARFRLKPGSRPVSLRLLKKDGSEELLSLGLVDLKAGIPAVVHASVY